MGRKMSSTPVTERFTGRASFYAKHRPGYPARLLDDLFQNGVLHPGDRVADLGSGTGIFTELLLARGLRVFAVEPNDDMRLEAEGRLNARKGFTSVNGRAEATTLGSGSVEAATAAQSYHWFDPEPTRAELRRILVPDGWVVLLWNKRVKDKDDYSREYEELVTRYSPEHEGIESDKESPERILGSSRFEHRTYEHHRHLDLEAQKGMAASVSYLPAPGQHGYESFTDELERLFRRHAVDGKVTVYLRAECCFGRLD